MELKKNPPVNQVPIENFTLYTKTLIQSLEFRRKKNEFLFRAAVICHLLEKFKAEEDIKVKISEYFLITKSDVRNIHRVHSSRIKNKKYKTYLYFCNLINNLPPIVITESTTPKIIKPRKEKHADIVFTKGEIKFANMIINSILQYAGVKSFKVLVTISDRSKIKSYRTIATILFMKKYPETPRIHLFILFEKLKIKESFSIYLQRHEILFHKINNNNELAIWYRKMYITLSEQIEVATRNE